MMVFDVLSSGSVILRVELLFSSDLVLKAYVFVTGSVAHAVCAIVSITARVRMRLNVFLNDFIARPS